MKYLKLAIIPISLLITFVFLYPNCSGHVENIGVKPNHDSIYKNEYKQDSIFNRTVKQNSVLKAKNDSLMNRKPIYIIRYKTKFDSLYFADTSCQKSFTILYNEFGKLNDLNDSIIANNIARLKNDSIGMSALINLVNLKQDHITIDSTYITRLCDSIPKVKRKGYFKGLKHGVVIGALIVESINVGAKLKP